MAENLIELGYIPLDKSFHIRMASLDMFKGYDDSIRFFEKFKKEHPNQLSGDLESTLQASSDWGDGRPIGTESATLYRILWYASNKFGLDKVFERQGTLIGRELGDTPEKLEMSLGELEALETSQWATAYVLANYALTGKLETIPTDKHKLRETYKAVRHWESRPHGVIWESRYDQPILNQDMAYLKWLKTGVMDYTPKHSEDGPFAIAFGLRTPEQAMEKWPSLPNHESDRIKETLAQLELDEVTSKDHRVIKAILMKKKGKVKIIHPEAINKSDPVFLNFMRYAPTL